MKTVFWLHGHYGFNANISFTFEAIKTLCSSHISKFRAFCKRFGDFWVYLKFLVAMATLKTTDIEMTYKDFRDGC